VIASCPLSAAAHRMRWRGSPAGVPGATGSGNQTFSRTTTGIGNLYSNSTGAVG